jgi:hypothetical protein
MTFDGFGASLAFTYNIGDTKDPAQYILGNSTVTEPSYRFTAGASYAAGYGIYFTNSYVGTTAFGGDFNVWIIQSGINYGPYVYTYEFGATGAVDYPVGKFHSNSSLITSAFMFQFSRIDKNGNDLSSRLALGGGLFITNCAGLTPPL